MGEKRNYVIYIDNGGFQNDEIERVVKMTETQAKTIEWFINKFNISGCIELAEHYEGEEI